MNDLNELNDFNDILAGLCAEAVEQIISSSLPFGSADPETTQRRSDWKWFEELTLEDQITWVIKNLIPHSTLSLIYGAPGTGKSFFAVDLAVSIALGIDLLGLRVSPGPVLYVALEGGWALKARFLAQRTRYSELETDRSPLAICSTSLNLCTSSDDAQLLIREVQNEFGGNPPKVIMVDTLARAISS